MRRQRYHGLECAILAAGVAAGAWWWTRNRPFRVAVTGESMAPTLVEGDFLVATTSIEGAIGPGSLVVVAHPERPEYEMIKRVTRVLGPTGFWVEGDNAVASTDSRSFGPVATHAIRGVIRLRYWPFARAGLL
jgi:nickel-type superoxide dismutase maturation protease